jgi:hypothetical protein
MREKKHHNKNFSALNHKFGKSKTRFLMAAGFGIHKAFLKLPLQYSHDFRWCCYCSSGFFKEKTCSRIFL